MALTHTAAARNAGVDAILALLNVGGAGKIVLQTSASAAVATLTLSATAFGSAAAGVATAAAITSDTNAVGGTTTKFSMTDGASLEIFNGTVGTSGTDIVLSSTTIGASDTVSISSMTYTAGA